MDSFGLLHAIITLRGAPHLSSIHENMLHIVISTKVKSTIPLNTFYFIYLSWKFCLNFVFIPSYLVFRMPFEFFDNFNLLFANNYFIICNLVRPLWIITFYSHFCVFDDSQLCYFFEFPLCFPMGLSFGSALPCQLTFLSSVSYFWPPLMKWHTIYGTFWMCLN